jgi:Ca2+-binding EF-hand superfamily protein
LSKVASELGEALSEEEIKELLSKAAKNGKTITREDFYNIMTK